MWIADGGFGQAVKVTRTPRIAQHEQASKLGEVMQLVYLPADPESVIPQESIRHFGGLARWWLELLVGLLLWLGLLIYAGVLWKQNRGATAP